MITLSLAVLIRRLPATCMETITLRVHRFGVASDREEKPFSWQQN